MFSLLSVYAWDIIAKCVCVCVCESVGLCVCVCEKRSQRFSLRDWSGPQFYASFQFSYFDSLIFSWENYTGTEPKKKKKISDIASWNSQVELGQSEYGGGAVVN